MNEEEQRNMNGLATRVDQLAGMVENLTRAIARIQGPPPLQVDPQGINTDIDPDFAINAGHPERSQETRHGSRRSSLLQGLPPLMTPQQPARETTRATHQPPPPDNQPTVQVVATEIKVKEEDKLSVVTIKAVRRLQRIYRAHKKEYKYSELELPDFIKYSVLADIRSNELSLKTDLSKSLLTVEDLKYVGDVSILNGMARFYRARVLDGQGSVATRLYLEVEKIKWPPEYHNNKTDTWAINPDGFHLTMYPRVLEWTSAVRESIQFMYHGATQDELLYDLPPVTFGQRHDPGLIQMAMRGLGELSESLTTLISQKRLELIKDITEWENLLNDVFTGYSEQSLALARQRAQATKTEKVDDLWKRSQESQRKSEETPFVMPRPRPFSQSYHGQRGAVIHGYENEEDSQQEKGAMLALTESPINANEDSMYYSTYSAQDLGFEAESENELMVFAGGASVKDTTGLPCFGDYEGGCKLGEACPFVKSHGDRVLMKERTRRLVTQVLKSRYGGREMIAEIIAEYQSKQNQQPSPASQDYRRVPIQEMKRTDDRRPYAQDSPPNRSLSSRPQDTAQPARSGIGNGMRGGGDYGRGGGRLVTYGGRGNMGRGQYTNHLIVDDQGEHDQVEEVLEGEESS